MDHLKLTVDKLSVDAVSELVVDDSCGAVSIFVGTTRDNFEGKKVLRLEYEAYEPMALKALKAVCDEVRGRHGAVRGIAIYHRLGNVPCREASVIIAVSSPHRRDSLDAVSLCIDLLKAKVPVWKREVYEDAAPAWKENVECDSTPSPPDTVDPSLVQINVTTEELQQRIQNFIERKREQVNISNIHDFIPGVEEETEDTCARVRTQFVRRSDSKGHLKIYIRTRVYTLLISPRRNFIERKREQVNISNMHDFIPGVEEEIEDTCARVRTQFVRRSDSKGHLKIRKVHNEWGPQTVSSFTPPAPAATALPGAIAERVQNIEKFLNIGPVPPDIYKRLKQMEDRIAALQAVSPEYADFWKTQKDESDTEQKPTVDFIYSADDIARKIEQLERMEDV